MIDNLCTFCNKKLSIAESLANNNRDYYSMTCGHCSKQNSIYNYIVFRFTARPETNNNLLSITYLSKRAIRLAHISYANNITIIPDKKTYMSFHTLYEAVYNYIDNRYIKFDFAANIRPDNFHNEIVRLQNLYVFS